LKDFFNNIVKWSALITTIYLVVAIFRTTLYYSYFGIDIYTYIETSEVFTVYLPITIFTFLITCLPAAFLIFIRHLQPKQPGYRYYNFLPFIWLI